MSINPEFHAAIADAADPWAKVRSAVEAWPEVWGNGEAHFKGIRERYSTPQEWVNESTKNWTLTEKPKEYAKLKSAHDQAKNHLREVLRKQRLTSDEARKLVATKRHNKTERIVSLKHAIDAKDVADEALENFLYDEAEVDEEDEEAEDLAYTNSTHFKKKMGEIAELYLRQ